MNAAVTPIVVGRLAAHTPSRLISFSLSKNTASGVAHPKQPVSPGTMIYMCDD